MTLGEYQNLAARTMAPTTDEQRSIMVAALGLTGEAGEVADLVKKWAGHGHTLDRDKLVAELGDVAWYLAALCTYLGVSLDDVASGNVEKLKRRYPEGFSTERSVNRTE